MNIIITSIIALSVSLTGSASQAPSQAPLNALSQVVEAQAPHIPHFLTRCEEDMPFWDCKTMGNLLCGPSQAPVEDHITAPTPAPKMATVSLKQAPKASVKAPVKAPAKQAPKAAKKAPKKATAPLITAPTAKGQTEAWSHFETNGFTEDELSKPFSVTYRGMVKQTSILPDGHEWYLVPSSKKGMDHVFELDFSAK